MPANTMQEQDRATTAAAAGSSSSSMKKLGTQATGRRMLVVC
jgi:hypothetical protein